MQKKPVVHLPRKRPQQDRARFTVQVIYDGFVRIWCRQGPEAVTTRAIAEESGFAVGTIYEYFPNTTALLSGYVRHCIEWDIERIRTRDLQQRDAAWTERLFDVVRVLAGADPEAPYLDRTMLLQEGQIALETHHRRAYERLSDTWIKIVSGWPDLPNPPAPEVIRTLFTMVWGGRRYRLLAQVEARELGDWLDSTYDMCLSLIGAPTDQGRTTI